MNVGTLYLILLPRIEQTSLRNMVSMTCKIRLRSPIFDFNLASHVLLCCIYAVNLETSCKLSTSNFINDFNLEIASVCELGNWVQDKLDEGKKGQMGY